MKPLYIIPARGGSKGIPHKNIKPLAGIPLIGYSITAAKEASRRSGGYILLSSDDPEIIDCARGLGIDVHYRRPAALGADNTGSREVILDAMEWADREGIAYDCVVLLQPTSPLRTVQDVMAAEDMYNPDLDMVVSVAPTGANPYYNIFEVGADGFIHVSKGDGLYTRRQDCPEVYEQNGAVYVINPDSLRSMPLGAFPRRLPFVMPAERSIDLDTPADWAVAESIISNLKE